MSKNIYVGVDPGLSGAVAILMEDEEGGLAIHSVHKLPFKKVTRDVSKVSAAPKKELDINKLVDVLDIIFTKLCKESDIVIKAHIENVSPRGRDGKKSICTMCRNYGACIGAFDVLGVDITPIDPKAWKGDKGLFTVLSKDKDASIDLVKEIFGEEEFTRHKIGKNHDKAEAILIAMLGVDNVTEKFNVTD